MAKLSGTATISVNISLVLPEGEARALLAIATYDSQEFLRIYKEKMGSRLDGREKDLSSLFASIRLLLPPVIKNIDDARSSFSGETDNCNG